MKTFGECGFQYAGRSCSSEGTRKSYGTKPEQLAVPGALLGRLAQLGVDGARDCAEDGHPQQPDQVTQLAARGIGSACEIVRTLSIMDPPSAGASRKPCAGPALA